MFEELKKRFQSTESIVSLILGLAVVFLIGTVVINTIKNKSTAPGATSTEKKDEATAQPISSPTPHEVVAGDTLWAISEKYYKTGYNWPDLVAANAIVNADHIEVGQKLTIPVVTPIFPPGQVNGGVMDKKPEAKNYTIVSGDNLWNIAVAQYSNGYRWTDVAKANGLVNPNLIHPGNVLSLP